MTHRTSSTKAARRSKLPASPSRQAGLTLIELMVALVLGLLIAAAAVAALIVARQGFTSVDESSQLRENARFAASLIQRIAVEAGFVNQAEGQTFDFAATPLSNPEQPGVRGWDNALLDATILPADQTHDSRDAGCTVTDTSCENGSDILAVKFMGVSRPVGSATPDGSMVNCAGVAEPESASPAWSIFHVVRGASGEPVLVCTYREATALAAWKSQPLVQGVESFQVLYGVDTLTAAGTAGQDSVADHYLRAADVDAAAAWRQVRTLRIGLVLRGPAGGAVDKAASAETIPVLGAGFSDGGDTMSDLVVPADGRVRQRLVFTVHLRNAQDEP